MKQFLANCKPVWDRLANRIPLNDSAVSRHAILRISDALHAGLWSLRHMGRGLCCGKKVHPWLSGPQRVAKLANITRNTRIDTSYDKIMISWLWSCGFIFVRGKKTCNSHMFELRICRKKTWLGTVGFGSDVHCATFLCGFFIVPRTKLSRSNHERKKANLSRVIFNPCS